MTAACKHGVCVLVWELHGVLMSLMRGLVCHAMAGVCMISVLLGCKRYGIAAA